MENREIRALELIHCDKITSKIKICRMGMEYDKDRFTVYAGPFEYLINLREDRAIVIRDFRVPRNY